MYLNCFDEVKNITRDLVKIPSIVRQGGESDVAKWIYDYYMDMDYFKKNPDQVVFQETLNDEVLRHNAIALVKGTKGVSNRTVVMMGHIDTVGVDDFGTNWKAAFDPDRLPEILKEMNVSEEVLEDIESGDYMFGRGALDMKAGVAGHMYLIKYFAENPGELDGNLVAIAECDEEDNSHGIISALKILKQWKRDHGLEYVAAINADYSTPYHRKDQNRYVYFGTIGKLLPSFYVTGKETHVGDSFGGFNPNTLVAEITRKIDLNPDLCDEAQGEVTVPPTSLKQTDTKVGYTVQTPLAAYSYYNFFTHSMSPRDVILKMKDKAEEAFDEVLERMDQSYRKYCEMGGHTYTPFPYRTRVYTWEEFYNELLTIHGDKFKLAIKNFAADLNEKNPSMDLRDFSVAVIEEAWKWSQDKSPVVIIYYSSLFSSRIEMTGKTDKEKALLDSVKGSIDLVQDHSDKPIVVKMFYPYISDSSFMALSDDPHELVALERNMPSWGTKYNHPIDDIMDINVPVVNIGTYGKDGHKFTERVHMRYTFENVTNMTFNTIKSLLG
ncbi:MAG: M20/M25/M40 family metallo-hydrolase [Gudongella sp.]|nr:M20/M25/M40 family metallo-hydrolase [Gudongella sp.]